MENTRMKQLLVWCGRRALDSLGDAPPVPPPSQGSSGGVDQSARHIARVIAESVVKEISTNGALSTWFTRANSPASAAIKKPNPKNEENQTKEKELLAQLESLDTECSTWKALRALDKPDFPLLPAEGDDDHTALLRPAERAFAEARRSGDDVIAAAKRLVKQQTTDIEFDMDRFADSVHRLQIYGDAADRLAGQVLVGAGEAVRRNDAIVKKTVGTDGLPLQEVLRSISNTSHHHLHAAS
ncbi:kinetochore-associated protein Dsn1/Mis13 [Tricharina praecox]|uniref:kinetochore-associated protein Dsn1/Mis13 n=1 Tax=Tricharina praecox TaxID=43433 RepID=UPI0022200262|nr:kinetochore-associated protein Dsn1/Mis13 [Tricharina praecox]KAI5853979.1 kinetochore-associated protein Dsn1/Mis13 [Tricharina praecox]